jgi:hypothetical protein
MEEIKRYLIPRNGQSVSSLNWVGENLIDCVGDRIVFGLDDTSTKVRSLFGYRFDKAIISADAQYSVIYENLGTKGIILKEGRFVREINRSYYCADAYEYPVAFFNLADGRPVIAHCPDEYCKIEIEEIETGKKLTSRTNKPDDFFHSRLQVSPDGRYLLSCGWVWHPWDTIELFDVERALKEPDSLDQPWKGNLLGIEGEIHSAAFNGAGKIVIAADEDEQSKPVLCTYKIDEDRITSSFRLEEHMGILMPMGDFVVGFYEHPKLFNLKTGIIEHRWDDLTSGDQNSSIISHINEKLPKIALDPKNKRFAVAGAEEITVIQLG